jgi:ribA/ribD-fused uncharacterized protein
MRRRRKTAFLDISSTETGAWKGAAAAATPTLRYGSAEVYAFPPFLNQTNPKQGFLILCLLEEQSPAAPPAGEACLPNSAWSPFIIRGVQYPSVEHYFQASKFTPHSPGDVAEILASPPRRAVEIGRDPARPLRQDWDKIRVNVMYEGLLAKFTQHPQMLQALVRDGSPNCHGASDLFWGPGTPGAPGQNMLWQLMARVRDECIAAAQEGCVASAGRTIRAKISCSATKLPCAPPGAMGPAPGLPAHMAGYGLLARIVADMLRMTTGRAPIGPVGGHLNGEDPVFSIYTEDPDDPGRFEVITAQIFIKKFAAGKAGRTVLEQMVLDGLSDARQYLMKDKRLPYNQAAPRSPGHLFPVFVPEVEAIRPMLAQDGRSPEETEATLASRFPGQSVLVQPKLDGMRLLTRRRVGSQEIEMITRTGASHPIVREFGAELEPLLAELEARLRESAGPGAEVVLDGELYVHRVPPGVVAEISMTDTDWKKAGETGRPAPVGDPIPLELAKIVGAASSYGKGSTAAARNATLVSYLEYHIFTYFSPGCDDPGAVTRYRRLRTYLTADGLGSPRSGGPGLGNRRVWLVPARILPEATGPRLTAASEEVLGHGYEGLMVYTAGGVYEPGRRSWGLLKLKATESEWFQITGTVPERDQELANIRYRYGAGEFVAAGFFSDEVKRLLFRCPDRFVGWWANIRYQLVTTNSRSGGALRDPKVQWISMTQGGAPVDLEALAAGS